MMFVCCFARVSSAAEEMDQADEELRETIRHIWPLQARKILDLLIPKSDCGFSIRYYCNLYSRQTDFINLTVSTGTGLNSGKLTVGKIYAGLLILESWKSTRFGQVESANPQVIYIRIHEPVFGIRVSVIIWKKKSRKKK